jgi:1-acyl-sn-glycerol-3-phosphate acyltransferase
MRPMIDQARLEAISLRERPLAQRVVAWLFLTPNYHFPGRRTRIVLEGEEHLPKGGAILVMNHTDRYNYWPFQYELYRRGLGYTATWVKGKYYENPAIAWFMDATNNIPLPSKGYVLTKDFQMAKGRAPTEAEYDALKRLADGELDEAGAGQAGGAEVAAFLARAWPEGSWAADLEARFSRMMRRVVELNQQALDKGLYLLIFPQGTRSRHLTRGHTGAAQVILQTGAPVVPIGCNGSDQLYPRNSPVSRGGTVTYRIGRPLTRDGELARFRIDEPFTPFTREAERHHATFRALTDVLMDRINALLDPPYQYAEGEGARGAARFL